MPYYYYIYKVLHKLKFGRMLYPFLYLCEKVFCHPVLPNRNKSVNLINSIDYHDDSHYESHDNNKYGMNPKYDLEIIIPVYNSEKYIQTCVDSVLNQKTKYKFKIIIINDGSTDKTLHILRLYKNNPIIQIINQKNLGRSCARNIGLNQAKNYRYIMFVDSDDLLMPNSIEHLLDNAYRFDSDITFGGYNLFNHGGIIKKVQYKLNNHIHLNSSDDINGYLWGKVFKASLFRDIHFPEGYEFEDTILAFLVYPKCHIIDSINNVVYLYRDNPKSITHTFRESNVAIDSYLITKLLIKSLSSHRIEINEYLYNTFLSQIKMNFRRNIYEDVDIQKSIFVLSCALFETYFKGFHTNIKYYRPLENAMINKDYNNYVLACLLL